MTSNQPNLPTQKNVGCSSKKHKGKPVKIHLEKETKQEVLAALAQSQNVPEGSGSTLCSLKPSHSVVNLAENKDIRDSSVVKAFNEAERNKCAQSK
ncbi:hypothetical protein Q1695_005912 [Nippostrongylus brasiliensis]|nr:hypothetical protein Q1695_005912 [Nippostrongylus brasiliensis]